jgi:glutamate dehydrogenase (NADP+)
MTLFDALDDTDAFMDWFDERYPGQPEYRQAVEAFVGNVLEDARANDSFRSRCVLQRLTEPDRQVSFRVVWEDDEGRVQMNRGYRIQHSGLLGPYKGGLRFVPGLHMDTLRFLAFEQTAKNALTGLMLGAGKGGADFASREHSDRETERFCQAFMIELCRHIGPDTDVPAGDIGVGPREIGFLFGQYRRLANSFSGALTGKGEPYGGSELRLEATGYGAIYFLAHLLESRGESIENKRIALSGAGNVATYAAEKITHLGGRVISLSSRDGRLSAPDGLSCEQIARVRADRAGGRDLADSAEAMSLPFETDCSPWTLECDVAVPAATQNEIDDDDARALVDGGCDIVVEAANMPLTAPAHRILRESGVTIAPGKAANAGGVAVSAYEMLQNRTGITWRAERVDEALKEIMGRIYRRTCEFADNDDYERGADRAAFARLADAMVAMGTV